MTLIKYYDYTRQIKITYNGQTDEHKLTLSTADRQLYQGSILLSFEQANHLIESLKMECE